MTRPLLVIVDDNLHAARRLAARLEDDGWSVTVAGGSTAIAMLPASTADLVLADLQLVEVEVHRVIDAALAADPDLPVIVMASFATIDEAIQVMRRGAQAYVVKPVRFDELSLVATRAVEQLAIRRECRRLRRDPEDVLVPLREIEERHIRRVLEHCHGNKTRAAEILGIDPSTLYRKLRLASSRREEPSPGAPHADVDDSLEGSIDCGHPRSDPARSKSLSQGSNTAA